MTSLYQEPDPEPEPPASPALELVDVFKLYRSGSVETAALRGLDLRVERGELVAVLGPSGSGKSTFLHLAAGLEDVSVGQVRVFGEALGGVGERYLAAYRARTVAVVLQSGNLPSWLTARENVLVALALAGRDDAAWRAHSALARFGLERSADRRPASLSGGEQQRVAIAAAAAREAQLVLADEPTGELDARNEHIVLESLHELRAEHGATVVVVTHSRRVAGAADRVVQFLDGRVIAA
jgi:putative ABC transport system ATP-binding protein